MTNTQLFNEALKRGLRAGYFDVETSPVLVWTYSTHDVYIPHGQIEQDKKITSVAWMFEGEKKPHILEWGKKRDDKPMLTEAVKVLNSADILIGQNSDGFDIKTIQWRLNVLRLPPLNNVTSIDTLKLSRKAFLGSSHTLDYRSRVYDLGGKIKQDMDNCIAVAKGDRKQQAIRMIYNIKDVLDLREIFWKELDYTVLPKYLVNMLHLFIKNKTPEFCIKCASRKQARYNVTQVKNYMNCDNCGHRWRVN